MKNLTFIFGIIFFLCFLNSVSARPLSCADNPLALWHFNEGIGSITTDSCNGISGIINGNFAWIDGKYGKSIAFNGYNTYVNLTGKINQSFNDFSILAWVKADGGINTDYQTFIGREINYGGGYYWNFALAKDSINQGYPESSYFNIFDGANQNVVGTYFSQYNTVTDGNWHLLIGTFNSTEQSMTFYYDGNYVTSVITPFTFIPSSTDYFFMGTAFSSDIWNFAYFLNGSLDEVAIFNRTLSQDEITDYYSDIPANPVCYNQTGQQLLVSSYPYVDFNINYPIQYFIYSNNLPSYVGNVSIDIQEFDGNISTFNFNWNYATNGYDLTLLFTTIGNYPFTIYSSFCSNINNFTGEFIVREPFNVTFCGFKKNGDTSSVYENNYAYLIAEFTTAKKYYNTNLEQFITPLGFATTFRTPVFHTLYRDGCGTFKLYEVNEEYAVRLFDGIATYQTTFSQPNISRTYGTNIYFGKYTFNGTDESFNVLFDEKDIHQYTWLFNTLFIFLLIGTFIISIFLFFVIPEKPSLSVIFGLGFLISLVIIRIVIWLYWG